MTPRQKKLNVILIMAAVLLAIGIVIVCIIGERRLRQNQKKDYSGAREVNANIIDEIKRE